MTGKQQVHRDLVAWDDKTLAASAGYICRQATSRQTTCIVSIKALTHHIFRSMQAKASWRGGQQ
jgi:hypothetical protein